MKSWSLAREVPPGLTARNRISSCLNVVGLSTTRTPLDICHSVMPNASFVDVVAIVPGAGSGVEQRLRTDRIDVGRQRVRRSPP